MKLEINVQDIHETVEVKDAEAALKKVKAEAASRAPVFMRGVIKSLGDITFAQEAVKRANAAEKRTDALPKSAQEFLEWAIHRGYVTVIEE